MTTVSKSKTATRLALLACAGLALAGCGRMGVWSSGDRPIFDGQYFRANVEAAKETPEVFTVTVRDAGKSLAGAREAGRSEATSHCIEYFGNSRMTWGASNPDAADAALLIQNGDLVMSGTCAGW